MKISDETTRAAYRVAREIYEGHLRREDGIDQLEQQFLLNRNSAADFIQDFSFMLAGQKYVRTLNTYATEYFLSNIHHDYGNDGLRRALSAVEQHIEYYEGLGRGNLNSIREVFTRFELHLDANTDPVYPDEVQDAYFEGAGKQVIVNVFERDPGARKACIDHYGCSCIVCSFNFAQTYGQIGESFIHVHHLVELSTIRSEYKVDPIRDLRPVCPNCHAMLHKRKPAYSIEELKQQYTAN